ncbi:response regulator [Microbacterium maritypicum]|uniref:response regulator n=1 Tax=Microbacterium maritypicum TaxID=33918 RepID=UPI00380061C0
MLVDDHAVVRAGVRALLDAAADVEVVAEASDGNAALAELNRRATIGGMPDVMVVDLVMPKLDGEATTREARRRYPDLGIVVMSSFGDVGRVQTLLAAGANGYISKASDPTQALSAIRAAANAEMYLDPAAARVVTQALIHPVESALSDREREVLRQVALGQSNKEIATTLHMSERTARTHVSNVLAKLGLHSRTQAALWALRQGFVSLD